MLTLGLLSIRYDHETEYFTEIAKRSADFNIKVVRLRPADLRPNINSIDGLSYDCKTKQWQRDSFPLPNFLYDRCFYRGEQAKKYKPVVEWLKQRNDVTFIGHGLPNKLEVMDILFEQDILRPHIPPTQRAMHTKQVLEILQREQQVVLKPIYGSGGVDIYFLTKENQQIKMETQQGKKVLSKTLSAKDCTYFLQNLLMNQEYMIQSYLSLTDKENAPFDLRIFLQKSPNGLWEQKGMGIRKGRPHSLISNLRGGSQIETYHSWRKSIQGSKKIERHIHQIIKHVPLLLERQLAPLFELGLDIGIDQHNHIWILDVNSKPGRKVVLQTNPDIHSELYAAPLAYCQFLAGKGVKTLG